MARTDTPYLVTPRRPRFNVLLYGEPGTSKTTIAASAQDSPFMSDVLFLNIEGGMLSVAHRGDIHSIDIENCKQIEEIFWKLQTKQPGFDTYKTIVVDSGTDMQTLNLQEIVVAAVKKAESKNRNARNDPNKKVHTLDEIWQDDYGKSNTFLKRIFRQFKELPQHVVITALAKFVYPKTSDAEGRPRTDAMAKALDIEPMVVMPALTQKVGEALMGYMDFVWYTFIDPNDGKYKILTRTNGAYRAKTRGPHFQKEIGDVTEVTSLATLYDTYVRVESAGAATIRKSARKQSSNRA